MVSTVIGFALFAEFFSSSANQDVKASVLLERNSAYQATLTNDGSSQSTVNPSLIASIANAEQKLARCEANLKLGKEKHCDGDRAKVAALKSSEQSANQAQAQANIQRDKLKYERQDALKVESYNPVIITLARSLAGNNGDYKDYLKTAVVLITLFGASLAAIEDLELGIAKYSAQPEPVLPSAPDHVQPITEPNKQPIGFGFPTTAPSTAQVQHKPVLFKYQQVVNEVYKIPTTDKQGFVGFVNPLTQTKRTEEPLPLPEFGGFKAMTACMANG